MVPNEVTEEMLLDVHTPEYLRQIKTSKMKVAEVKSTFMLATSSQQDLFALNIHVMPVSG